MAFRGIIPRPDHLRLRFRPGHDRNAADAILRAAFDDPVAVGHIDQHVALLVEEAHDLKRLEDEAASLVEDALAIFDFALDLDRADLPARDAGVAGVLGHTQSALHSSRLGSADVAGDALDLGVVKTVDDDLVIRPQQPKLCIDGAGGARSGRLMIHTLRRTTTSTTTVPRTSPSLLTMSQPLSRRLAMPW